MNMILLVVLVNGYALKTSASESRQSFYMTTAELQLSNIKEKFKAVNDGDALSQYISEWRQMIASSLPHGKAQIKNKNNKVYVTIEWRINHNNYEKSIWFNIN